ncbi:MAG: hypothetical protein QOC72_45 [Methylobacteriaceae bacterium]|jgi:hypothetical protein|nr:hypothetical protein [Methylobacteriaceae bacterium]
MGESASSSMMVEHPAPHRDRVPIAILIFEVFVGPVAWGLHLLANSAIAGQLCYPGPAPLLTHAPSEAALRFLLGGSGALAILLALIGTYVSYKSWRATRREREGSHHDLMEVGEGRTRFFAFAGLFTGLVFALVIFCDTVSILLVPICGK